MTREEFNALVQKLETYAQRQPASYKLRVGLLAVLGYAYIFVVLAVLLTALAIVVLFVVYSRQINSAFIKLLILLLVPIFIVLRSLWVSIGPPKGLELRRQQVLEQSFWTKVYNGALPRGKRGVFGAESGAVFSSTAVLRFGGEAEAIILRNG